MSSLQDEIDMQVMAVFDEDDLRNLALDDQATNVAAGSPQWFEDCLEHHFHRLFKMARMVDRAYQRQVLMQSRQLLSQDERKASLLELSLNRANHKISMLESSHARADDEHVSLLKQVINMEDQQTVSLLHHTMLKRIQEVFSDLSDAMIHITINEKDMEIQVKTPLISPLLPTAQERSLSQLLQVDIDGAIKAHELLSYLSEELKAFFSTEPKKIPEINRLSQRVNAEMERLRAFQKFTEDTLNEIPAKATQEVRDAFVFALNYINDMLGEWLFIFTAKRLVECRRQST